MATITTQRFSIARDHPPSADTEPELWEHLEEIGCYRGHSRTVVDMQDTRNGWVYTFSFSNDAPGAYVWQLPTFEERVEHIKQEREMRRYSQACELALPFWKRPTWYQSSWRARWRWARARLRSLITSGELDDIPF